MLIRVGQDPKRVFHIHFGLDAADLMLLPGERIHEPYRTPEEVSELEKMMSSWSVFDTSERIVVYGHSLDPMEAELRTILHLALSESTGEIVVANLREEIPRVTARLRPLLPQGDGWRISSEIVGPNR